MSENLYKIAGDMGVIIDEIIEGGGEISPELEARLDQGELALKGKIENVIKFLLNSDGDIAAIDAEVARLQLRKKYRVNAKARLKDYLLMNMQRVDMLKYECPSFSAAIQKNPASVVVVDEGEVPSDFKEPRMTVFIDKKMILAELKAGKSVPGARLAEVKYNLRIR